MSAVGPDDPAHTPFDPGGPLPIGLTALEASAGTGKTYALAALAARFVAERDLRIGGLCVVSFTEAATAELRGRVRSRLVEAADHLAAGAPRVDDPVLSAIALADRSERSHGVREERDRRLGRLRDAIADFDAASITTIHGFCSRLLAGAGALPNDAPVTDGGSDVEEVVNDLLLERYADQPDALVKPASLVNAVRTRLTMPDAVMRTFRIGAAPISSAKNAITEFESKSLVNAMAELVEEACRRVVVRRGAERRRTFDGLLVQARELLRSPEGVATIAALRQRYGLVLVDEFQDTDRVQWDIFRRAFVGGEDAPTMVLVGDPKQSIYRFRAAELSAYLEAVGQASTVATLGTNRRSDRPLLQSLEQLFAGFEFGSSDVVFQPVQAAPDRQHRRISGAGAASVELRWVHREDDELDTPRARDIVRRDVVATVIGLLSGDASGPVTIDVGREEPELRPLRARDIAILTRSNNDAAIVAMELSAAGVPAATASTNSVLDSEAARQWAVLLRALERPGSVGAARAAALGWFIGRPALEMATLDDDGLADLHDLLRDWSIALSQRGLPRLLSLAAGAGLHARLLEQHGGERHLTDLEHIGELLQAATGGRPVAASALLALLAAGAGTEEEEHASDLLARRIDRDDDAVQVLTVHRAKGLEFPVVLCPYMWTQHPASRGIPHAQLGTERVLDSAWVAENGQKKHKHKWIQDLRALNTAESEAEQRRLLYVALTRARHRCVVWWAPCTTRGASKSVLGELLAHATNVGDPKLLVEPAAVSDLVSASGGALAVQSVPPLATRPRFAGNLANTGELAVSTWSRQLDRTWRAWSFSGIKSAADERAVHVERAAEQHARSSEPGSATEVATSASAPAGASVSLLGDRDEAPLRGGADEPTSEQAFDIGDVEDIAAIGALGAVVAGAGADRAPAADAGPRPPLADAPAGTEFGTLVHEVLEVTDFASPSLRDDLIAELDARLRFRTFDVDAADLADGLVAAIDAPLGGPVGALRLRDLGRGDRLDELAFDMPLGRIRAAEIGAALAEHLDADDLLLPWARSMADAGFDVPVGGMLTGSIDLIARSGGRYWVADYKTNQLGADVDYTPPVMAAAMAHHHYPLQAALYLVALHRYLGWRLPGYAPERHLGGAAYLFVRGMDPARPADDTRGVFWWRPPAAAVVALDRLLAEGGAR